MTYFDLVPINPDGDNLLNWLTQQECWPEIEALWTDINKDGFKELIPLQVELELKEKLALDPNCLQLLEKLLPDMNGVELSRLGINPDDVEIAMDDGDCAWAILTRMGLARIQDKKMLKPLPVAFDSRVMYLVGQRPSH